MDEHLGYEKHDVSGRGSGNSRNGTRTKTVLTEIGPVEIDVPRDTAATFDPQIVRKRQRRLTGVDEIVLSLSAKGLTTGEIAAHFGALCGARSDRGDRRLLRASDTKNTTCPGAGAGLPQRHPHQDRADPDRPVEIDVPRDTGDVHPQIVRKRQRRLTGVDEIVLSLSAKGLTTGEIAAHFGEVFGARVSKDTISRITE